MTETETAKVAVPWAKLRMLGELTNNRKGNECLV